MGMYFLFYLIVYIATNVFIVVSSDVSSKDDLNLRALSSLLLAVNSSISRFLSSPKFIHISFNPTSSTQIYSQTSLALPLESPAGLLFFSFISLESSEFFIENPAEIGKEYRSPYVFTLVFRPVVVGVRTAYFLVKTREGFFIYYLQGISTTNQYNLQYYSLRVDEEVFGKVKIVNRDQLNISIEHFEGLPAKLETFNKTFKANDKGISDFLLFKASMKGLFSLNGKMLIKVNSEKYYLSITEKRKSHQIECSLFDLGVLVIPNALYSFGIKCEKDPGYDFKYSEVLSDTENVWFKPEQPLKSSNFFFGTLNVKTTSSGRFSGQIKLNCELDCFIIIYTYLAVFDIVKTEKSQLYFTTLFETNRTLCIENLLNHDIWIKKYILSSEIFLINPTSSSINPQDICCFSIKSRPVKVEQHSLMIETNIGKLVFPLYSIEPFLSFYLVKNTEISEISGLIDLGNIGSGVDVEKQIMIKNPNPIKIHVYSIQSPHQITKISANDIFQDMYEFKVAFRTLSSFFAPLKINTSLGSFYISLHFNVLPGSAQLKNVVFSGLYPKESKVEYVYLENSFPVAIKIFAVTVLGENVGIFTDVLEVPAGQQEIIGKVTGSFKLHEKTAVDFKKDVSASEIKRAISILHYKPSEKTYEIKAFTDLAGEIKANVVMLGKKPEILVVQQGKRSSCRLNTYCIFTVLIRNPLDIPIKTQLMVAPDNIRSTLKKFENLSKKKTDSLDDEFENIIHDSGPSNSDGSEFKNDIKNLNKANEKKLNPVARKKALKIWQKISYFLLHIFCGLEEKDKENTELYSQSLYLNSSNLINLPPYGSSLAGPIVFSPSSTQFASVPLVIRNNYTVLEFADVEFNVIYQNLTVTKKTSYLFANKTYSIKSYSKKETNKLVFDISPAEINSFAFSRSSIYTPVIFKTFDLQNLGNSDVLVKGVYINELQCESRGFLLNHCGDEFLLRPKEVFLIELSLNLLESWTSDQSKLWIRTETEDLSFNIESFVIEAKGLNMYLYSDLYYIFLLASALALSFTTVIHSFFKQKKFEIYSSKNTQFLAFNQYFLKKFTAPLKLAGHEQPSKQSENQSEEKDPPPAAPKKSRKSTKVKNNLTNIVQASDLKKGPARVLPDVIANNKFLKDKKKAKCLDSGNNEEDFFLDSYKTNCLFSGLANRDFYSLSELTQDSCPVDIDSINITTNS